MEYKDQIKKLYVDSLEKVKMPEHVRSSIMAEVAKREAAAKKKNQWTRRVAIGFVGVAAASAAAYFIPQFLFEHEDGTKLTLGSLVAYAQGSELEGKARLAKGFLSGTHGLSGGDTNYLLSNSIDLKVEGDNLSEIRYTFSGENWRVSDSDVLGLSLSDFVLQRDQYLGDQSTDTEGLSFTLNGDQVKKDDFQRNIDYRYVLTDEMKEAEKIILNYNDENSWNKCYEYQKAWNDLTVESYKLFYRDLNGTILRVDFSYKDGSSSYQRFVIDVDDDHIKQYESYMKGAIELAARSMYLNHNDADLADQKDAEDRWFEYLNISPT